MTEGTGLSLVPFSVLFIFRRISSVEQHQKRAVGTIDYPETDSPIAPTDTAIGTDALKRDYRVQPCSYQYVRISFWLCREASSAHCHVAPSSVN